MEALILLGSAGVATSNVSQDIVSPRSILPNRWAWNQTVLHQFCCPAPEAPEGESSACVPSDDLPPDSPSREEGEGEGEPPSQTEPQQPEPQARPDPEPQSQLNPEGTGIGEAEQEVPTAASPSPSKREAEQKEQEEGKHEEVVEPQEHQHERDATVAAEEVEVEEEGAGPRVGATGRRASLHHTASPMRVQRNGACSHSTTSDYELSLDLKNKQIEMLEHKYGGHLISRRAATKIQTAFRQYQLSKNFEKIRNSLLESRLPRRISLRKVRVQNAEGFSAERALAEGCNLAGIPLVRSPSLPTTVGASLTDLEDSFTEQVQSLAKSIDDALSNWSLKTMCSLQEGGTYQFSAESFSGAGAGGGAGGGGMDQAILQSLAGGDIPGDLPRSASKLLMAFRDVTVQIDNQNFRMSSSVVESSASVSMGNCVQQQQQGGGATTVTQDAPTNPAQSVSPPPSPKEPSPPPPEEVPAEPTDPPVPPQEPPPPPEPVIEGDVQDADFPAPPPSEEELEEEDEEEGQQPFTTPLDKLENPWTPEVVIQPIQATQAQDGAPSVGSPFTEALEAKRSTSETAETSSEQMSSSSTSTEARSASEASSKEALQAMILSLPRYHCENPASCKSPTLSTDVMRKRLYRIGLNLFNVNPDKGLQFLISRGFIPDTPIGVAHFLLQRKGLSRQMIGEFLGNSKKPFNRDVLDCVVDEMDFSGMELDEALRKFQAHIRVQGEAQKVERLIEAFSQRYCMCNPDVVQQFHNPDTIFILAFAIILLNTDMYSPNIKPDRKMMLEDFIRNLRGVDDGADIPRDMVVGIYERIQQRELRSNEDHVTYVTKVEQSIVGMKTVLSVPHRRLVCCSRLFEVTDVNKAQKQAAHQREVFLFNDLIVILKLCPKKKSSAAYTFCKAMGLLGMQFQLFENEYYPHGITIVSPFGSDKKQVLHFCAQSAEELLKFLEDLKESIAEVSEMEQIRIEWELEKQQGSKSLSNKNNGTLELRGKQGSPSGKHDQDDTSGLNAVEHAHPYMYSGCLGEPPPSPSPTPVSTAIRAAPWFGRETRWPSVSPLEPLGFPREKKRTAVFLTSPKPVCPTPMLHPPPPKHLSGGARPASLSPPPPTTPRMPVVMWSVTYRGLMKRLQTYQFSSSSSSGGAGGSGSLPRSPESARVLLSHQGEPFQQPHLQSAAGTPHHQRLQQLQPISPGDLRPDTLIQCQQIVKVIVLDNSGHGRVEAFLSHTPTHAHHHHHHHRAYHHQAVRSAASTPVRSPEGKDAHQPPLPPPPPPYNHPHQYIPPVDTHLSLRRTPSVSHSLM
ncbi:hypothetical protein DPEC_G00115350 [Dallia pectoralis]|uniref:Uncharacterized protein n=1 Tax=Dallia pectoralis TaxID=75939 RepID=A0ACC2GTW9_DALPE|nr:hypothetical protein DPEC_G00115350 [Dallia pectoralis]